MKYDRRKALFSIFVIVFFLGLSELVFRLVVSQEDLPSPLVLRDFSEQVFFQPDTLTIWSLKPNTHFQHRHLDVRINNIGLRGPDIRHDKNGRRRIVCLGGSTTFGWRLKEDVGYCRKLENLLNRETPEPGYEVINAGVPGFTSIQGIRLLLSKYDILDPDIVIFSFTFNDQNLRERPISETCAYLDSPLFKIRSILFRSRIVQYLAKVIESNIHTKPSVRSDRREKRYQKAVSLPEYKAALQRIFGICRARRIGLIFLTEMSHSECFPELDDYQAAMVAFAREHHVPCVNIHDVFDRLIRSSKSSPEELNETDEADPASIGGNKKLPRIKRTIQFENRPTRPPELSRFLMDSVHYKPEGCQVVAKQLADIILSEKIFFNPD